MPRGPGGRPKKEDAKGGTRHTRVYEDLADKIGWIVRLKGVTSAQLLDPMIRGEIEAIYAAISADVEAIRKIEGKRRKAEGRPKE